MHLPVSYFFYTKGRNLKVLLQEKINLKFLSRFVFPRITNTNAFSGEKTVVLNIFVKKFWVSSMPPSRLLKVVIYCKVFCKPPTSKDIFVRKFLWDGYFSEQPNHSSFLDFFPDVFLKPTIQLLQYTPNAHFQIMLSLNFAIPFMKKNLKYEFLFIVLIFWVTLVFLDI